MNAEKAEHYLRDRSRGPGYATAKDGHKSRVFITGSADGLGQMAARLLVQDGHEVILHGRSEVRAEQARAAVPGAIAAVAGDLSSIEETTRLASSVNNLGRCDAVIHNAGVGSGEPRRIQTVDRLPHVFAINTLAPYILTALIGKPARLVYLSSGLHQSGEPSLEDLSWASRRWNGFQAYSDSKLFDVVLAFGVARRWPDVLTNAVDPGWVATKMGGPGAPGDLTQGSATQVWLAISDDPAATVTGHYFYHQQKRTPNPAAHDEQLQDGLIDRCAEISGVPFPDA